MSPHPTEGRRSRAAFTADPEAFVTQLLRRMLLLRGPAWQRLFLLAFYLLAAGGAFYAACLCAFPPPDFYPGEYSDRMDRAMMFPAMILVPVFGLAVFSWAVAVLIFAAKAYICTLREGRRIWLALLAPGALYLGGVYAAGS